jgi:sulfur relay (sulfurtransferase) complex TusBCD TusD component (DsrE family)
MTIQANTARVVSVPPQQQTNTGRLLARWCELGALVAAAAAHHPGEEQSLFTMQMQVEKVLRDRSPKVGRIIDHLIIVFEVQIAHERSNVPAKQCVICRRARVEATLLPATVGSAL